MYKLDLKDRKILYELDLNCRQSNAQIGKKVGLKRDVIAYRIKKLENEGIIKNYYSEIDTFRLGYNVFRIYINFQYVNTDIKKDIIQYFINYQNSWAVISIKSEIDLAVVIWVKDIFEFYKFWDKTLDKYEDYFAKYAISIYIQAAVYKKSYLLTKEIKELDRKLFRISCGGRSAQIDNIDLKLINNLVENARTPLIELAEKLDCSSQNVSYRIKNLIKSGVIKAFRINLNLSKIGLHSFKVDIYLKNHKMKKKIVDYLESKSYLEFINFALGWSDLEPEFVVKNFDELIKIFEEIDHKFPNTIKKQTFFIIEKVHILRCMPKL
jgi:Lrp/AsnC family transcriptional regulator for asnA, asnC and gidA